MIDIGSGAGLPGVVWALVRPDLRIVCLEPLLRRETFLRETVARLQLDSRVEVVRGRAEDSPLRAPVITARAVAPLERLLGWALPLTEPGGEVLAFKGASAQAEIDQAQPVLARWGIQPEDVTVVECGRDIVDPPTRVVRIRRSETSKESR